MAKIPAISVPRPDLDNTTLSTLYLDGSPIEDLAALYEANTAALGGQKWNDPNRFWATPPRYAQSDRREVFEVSLATSRVVNRFSFQVSRFPCRVWLQYLGRDGKWHRVRHAKNRRPVRVTIRDSKPSVTTEDVSGNAHRHPQHTGAGHWRTVNVQARPIQASKFRLVLVRIPSRQVPRNKRRKPVRYSLAVKDFQVGMRITDRADVPRRDYISRTQVASETTTFSSSFDLLGSAVDFSLREYRARDILWPTLAAISGQQAADRQGKEAIWKSEPQPVANAVVNLYVDARDGDGEAQTVDRFFVDPTTTGVNMNLYYSNDTPSGDFEASDEPLRFPIVRNAGTSAVPTAAGVRFLPNDFGYVDIDLTGVQWRTTSAPWWATLLFSPQFASTSTDTWVLIDSRGLQVRWINQHLEIRVAGSWMVRNDLEFGVNEEIALTVAWTGRRSRAWMKGGWAAESMPDPGFEEPSGYLRKIARLGANRVPDGTDPGKSNFVLRSMMVKQEVLDFTPDDLFLARLADYPLEPYESDEADEALNVEDGEEGDEDDTEPVSDPSDTTTNAILRYHPKFQTSGANSLNPYGLLGGPGTNLYENLVWTPINRDYKLAKGYLQFDPVKAKYFKFEFTHLVPQAFSAPFPVRRKVRLFSSVTTAQQTRRQGNTTPANPGVGSALVQKIAGAFDFSYRDAARVAIDPDRRYPSYTPTEALYAADPTLAARLALANPIYSMQPWHIPMRPPRFVNVEKHHYETVEVAFTSKTAFFVGLRQIRMFRVDYAAADDTEAYTYRFLDSAHLSTDDSSPWQTSEVPGLRSGEVLPPTGRVQTTSAVLNSRRNVRGVQFATTQSTARQMLSDPDFNDPALTRWAAHGYAEASVSTDLTSDIGSTVKVSRTATDQSPSSQGHWAHMESLGTWSDIEDLDPDPDLPTWDVLTHGATDIESEGGLVGTEGIQPATQGRMYAACRVYAPQDLTKRLRLQIIGQDGDVLADAPVSVQAGQITEWSVGYTLGEGGEPAVEGGYRTWDEAETEAATWDAADLATPTLWNMLDGSPSSGYTGPVYPRVIQEGSTQDVFYVDNLSLFEDSILWEFSNDDGQTWWPVFDIRNNPHGVFLFPEVVSETSTLEGGTNLRWRVSGTRPNLHVSSLLIRPWYASMQLGMIPKQLIEHGGPNRNSYDQFPAVVDSPPFKAWAQPIPEDWFFLQRQWLLQEMAGVEDIEVGTGIVVPEAIVPGINQDPAPPQ